MYLKELCVSEITNILLSWKQFEYMLSEHLSVAKNIIVRIVNCCLLEKYLKIIKIIEVSKKETRYWVLMLFTDIYYRICHIEI